MERFLLVLWRMCRAYLFYPVMIGLFLWLYVSDAHWGFGLGVIAAILVFDRIWIRIAKNAIQMLKRR